MKLLINNVSITIEMKNYDFSIYNYDLKISSFDRDENYSGIIFIEDASKKTFLKVLDYVINKECNNLKFIIEARDIEEIKQFEQNELKLIEAGGGIVKKEDTILMIFRLGKWDLPKGKIKKRELETEAAIREVEEECGVKVKLDVPVITTYHHYYWKEKYTIKKTYWYAMTCLEDANMKPQIEEGIEKVEWKNKEQVQDALKNTFPNIKLILNRYYSLIDSYN